MSKYYSDETAKRICNLVGFKPNWTDKEVVSEILQRLESTPEQQALRRDAERYRRIRNSTGANSVSIHFSMPEYRLPDNWRHGSIAEHLDNAIDKARGGE